MGFLLVTLSKISYKWKQNSAVSFFLYLDSVFISDLFKWDEL